MLSMRGRNGVREPSSCSESPTARLSDAHPRSFPFVTAGHEPLDLHCGESRVDQFDHHIDGEAVSEHRRLSAAVAARGEQFERAAALRLEEMTHCRLVRRELNSPTAEYRFGAIHR
jgi:hypothetical protein